MHIFQKLLLKTYMNDDRWQPNEKKNLNKKYPNYLTILGADRLLVT